MSAGSGQDRKRDRLMRTYLDCYPCFLRQAIEAARLVAADEIRQHCILRAVLQELVSFELSSSPPEMAHRIHRIVRAESGVDDPYREAKRAGTEQALSLHPRSRALIAAAVDPLETAVRLSIAGNIIDLGTAPDYDLEATVDRVLAQPFAIGDLDDFRAALARSRGRLLYLADNAGETVFDRLLIETLDRPVTYAVRGAPVLNDATREDALAAGLATVAEIVDNGSDAPGTILPLCSPEFRRLFDGADLIVAKGQGNYECLSRSDRPVFFLLQAKCPVIARDLRVPVGSIVLKRGEGLPGGT
jgi:uncharacterized protein with ATP-grasp and redox domains